MINKNTYDKKVLSSPILNNDIKPCDFTFPSEEILHKHGCDDEGHFLGTALACMEYEEQRRIRSWHRLEKKNNVYWRIHSIPCKHLFFFISSANGCSSLAIQ